MDLVNNRVSWPMIGSRESQRHSARRNQVYNILSLSHYNHGCIYEFAYTVMKEK